MDGSMKHQTQEMLLVSCFLQTVNPNPNHVVFVLKPNQTFTIMVQHQTMFLFLKRQSDQKEFCRFIWRFVPENPDFNRATVRHQYCMTEQYAVVDIWRDCSILIYTKRGHQVEVV